MMKKRMFAGFTALAVLCSTILPGMTPKAQTAEARSTGTTYYVSTLHGKDSNDGMSEKTPFYSLQKINGLKLEPGDEILLECGSVFTDGYLHLYGQSGSEDEPIVIDQYGTGAAPIIDTNGEGVWYQNYGYRLDDQFHVYQGYISSSILLYDTEYIEINNLEIVNRAPQIEAAYNERYVMNRTGVAGVSKDKGTVDHIYLNGLHIHDVIGNVYDKHMNNGGIYFTVSQPHDEEQTGIARYNDVKIENCTVTNVNRWGIAVGYSVYWPYFKNKDISDEVSEQYASTNVLIRNNYIKEAGGDAITLMYCHRPLVEYNVSDAAARQINTKDYLIPQGRVAACIWPWKCKDAVFQYNESFDAQNGATGNDDAQAWDADSGDGTVYQYNYSHNNTGGCVMFCLQQAVRNTFRYNISQNDLKGAMDITNNPDAHVYNNVFYMKEDVPFIRKANRQGQGNMLVENNIIYYAGSSPRTETWAYNASKQKYSNNLYYNYANKPADDAAAVEVAAGTQVFQKAGSAPTATAAGAVYGHTNPEVRSAFDGYKLAENSPAIGKGKVIEDANGKEPCTVDFFGNLLEAGQIPDLGVHQYQANQSVLIPEAPQKVTASEATEDSITLSWPAVYDPTVDIAGYKVKDGDSVLATVTDGTSVTLTGLEAGKVYHLTILAYDANGYESMGREFTFQTAGIEEEPEPPVIPERTKLKDKLNEVQALREAEYTAESWKKLQAAVAEVQAVLEDANSTATKLNMAYLKLNMAVKALQPASVVQPSLRLDQAKATIYTKGKKTVTLKAALTGISGAVKWTSSKPKVAVVKNGKVTAKKAGKTVITAEAGAYKATCTVTVKKPALKLNKKSVSVKVKKTVKIKAKATPKGKMTYKSSNKKVATVTKKGVIKGIQAGNCKITVTCNGVKKVLKVKVK